MIVSSHFSSSRRHLVSTTDSSGSSSGQTRPLKLPRIGPHLKTKAAKKPTTTEKVATRPKKSHQKNRWLRSFISAVNVTEISDQFRLEVFFARFFSFIQIRMKICCSLLREPCRWHNGRLRWLGTERWWVRSRLAGNSLHESDNSLFWCPRFCFRS